MTSQSTSIQEVRGEGQSEIPHDTLRWLHLNDDEPQGASQLSYQAIRPMEITSPRPIIQIEIKKRFLLHPNGPTDKTGLGKTKSPHKATIILEGMAHLPANNVEKERERYLHLGNVLTLV
jgi:hypothetical protein